MGRMRTIWKFEAPVDDALTIAMPLGADVLSVQVQAGVPCIWARVDPGMPLESRAFCWRGTGHPADVLGPFIGTIQMHTLVFHLFEGPR